MSSTLYDFLRGEGARIELSEKDISFLKMKNIFTTNDSSSRVRSGNVIYISKKNKLEEFSGVLDGFNFPSIGSFSYTWSAFPVGSSIGRYCSIAGGMRIHGPRHPIEALTTSSIMYDKSFILIKEALNRSDFKGKMPFLIKKQTAPKLQHDVWVGSNVTLSPGVTLGTGCVIAAESVVTRDVPPYAIMGGNPAQLIKWRFPETLRRELLKTKWWKYHYSDIMKMKVSEPDIFLEEFHKRKSNLTIWEPCVLSYNDFFS